MPPRSSVRYDCAMGLQRTIDGMLERTLLPLIPRSVTPNMVSWLRIASLPFMYYFFVRDSYAIGLGIFSLAALTDALDGAMARTRGMITETGKVLDAVADRGLIMLVALMFIPRYFGWWLVAAIVVLECCNGFAAYRARRKLGFNPGANWAGKVKMTVQCAAFGLMFITILSGQEIYLTLALSLMLASLCFAFVQIFSYPATREATEYA